MDAVLQGEAHLTSSQIYQAKLASFMLRELVLCRNAASQEAQEEEEGTASWTGCARVACTTIAETS